MLLTSPAFQRNGMIPKKFTCDGSTSLATGGGNINPELLIQNVPEGTKSFALIMDDPDAPRGTFLHWLLWNIDPRTEVLKQESVPPGAIEGTNSSGEIGYIGPCPPSGTHRYFFKLYALDSVLALKAGASRNELESAMEGHILAAAELMGRYSRQ